MQQIIKIDRNEYESMKREIEVFKILDNDKFSRFIDFIDRLSESRAKVNAKYCINTFIDMELERHREIESKVLI